MKLRGLFAGLAALLLVAPVFAAPRSLDEVQAPRNDEVQAPRGQEVQAPRGEGGRSVSATSVQAP